MRIHEEMLGERLEVSESFHQGPVESLLGKGPFGPAGKSKDASHRSLKTRDKTGERRQTQNLQPFSVAGRCSSRIFCSVRKMLEKPHITKAATKEFAQGCSASMETKIFQTPRMYLLSIMRKCFSILLHNFFQRCLAQLVCPYPLRDIGLNKNQECIQKKKVTQMTLSFKTLVIIEQTLVRMSYLSNYVSIIEKQGRYNVFFSYYWVLER